MLCSLKVSKACRQCPVFSLWFPSYHTEHGSDKKFRTSSWTGHNVHQQNLSMRVCKCMALEKSMIVCCLSLSLIHKPLLRDDVKFIDVSWLFLKRNSSMSYSIFLLSWVWSKTYISDIVAFQVMTKEDIETLNLCKSMMERGECPPLMVVFDPKEGWVYKSAKHSFL